MAYAANFIHLIAYAAHYSRVSVIVIVGLRTRPLLIENGSFVLRRGSAVPPAGGRQVK